MEKKEEVKVETSRKKIVLRKNAIRVLDERELQNIIGGAEPPIAGDQKGTGP